MQDWTVFKEKICPQATRIQIYSKIYHKNGEIWRQQFDGLGSHQKRWHQNPHKMSGSNEFPCLEEVLKKGLMSIYDPWNLFQQDGAPCHKSRLVITFLDKGKTCVLSDWPAQSPDLNAIESLWRDLKARVSSCRPGNVETLWMTCEEQWTMIPGHVIQNLYKSIPMRI